MKKSRKKRRGEIYTHFTTDVVKAYCVALAKNRLERRLLSGVYPWRGMGGQYLRAGVALTGRMAALGILIHMWAPHYKERQVSIRPGTNVLLIELEMAKNQKKP